MRGEGPTVADLAMNVTESLAELVGREGLDRMLAEEQDQWTAGRRRLSIRPLGGIEEPVQPIPSKALPSR